MTSSSHSSFSESGNASSQDAATDAPFVLVAPYPPPYGGVSSHIVDLSKGLPPLGHPLHVLAYGTADAPAEQPQAGVTVYRSRVRPRFAHLAVLARNPIGTLRQIALWGRGVFASPRLYSAAFIKALMIERIADLAAAPAVGVYTTMEAAVVPFLRVGRPKLRLVQWVFAGPYLQREFYARHKTLYAKAFRGADRVMASSQYCAKVVSPFAPEVAVGVAYYGVDLDRFSPDRNQAAAKATLGLDSGLTVLFIGRMSPDMGAGTALRVATEVMRRRADVTFVIAGAEGPLTGEVTSIATQSGGRIIARVNVPGGELPDYYAAADILIAPTVGAHACMGVSIKEAMATGRASVVTNSGGIPEAIRDGIDGIVVPLRPDGTADDEALAAAVTRLCDDAQMRQEYGGNARQRAERLFDGRGTVRKVLNAMTGSDDGGAPSRRD